MDLVEPTLPDGVRQFPADIYGFIKRSVSHPELLQKITDEASGRGRWPRRELELFIRSVMSSVRDHLDDVRDILEFSSDTGYPAILTSSKVRPPVDTHWESDDSSTNLLITIRALVDEVIHLPWPGNFDEALQVRQRKEVRALRRQLQRWSEAVHVGDGKAQQQIRQSIARTSDSIRIAGRCRAVGGWITYASLPMSATEALTGSPPIGGLTLATLGAAAQTWGDAITWRNRWMVWGVRAESSRSKQSHPSAP